MYFPGDPLFALDPIYQSIPDPAARDRLVATYDHDVTEPRVGTGYRWDIVLTGSAPARRWSEEDAVTAHLAPDARPDRRPVLRLRAAVPAATASSSRPASPGRRPAARPRARRRGRPGARRAAGDLAGRPRRARSSAAGGLAAPRRLDVHRLGPRRDRRDGPLLVHHARPGADGGRRRAVLRGHRVRPRPARPAVHPRLPARTTGERWTGPAARRGSTRTGGARWSRRADDDGFALRHPAAGRAARPSSSPIPGH